MSTEATSLHIGLEVHVLTAVFTVPRLDHANDISCVCCADRLTRVGLLSRVTHFRFVNRLACTSCSTYCMRPVVCLGLQAVA